MVCSLAVAVCDSANLWRKIYRRNIRAGIKIFNIINVTGDFAVADRSACVNSSDTSGEEDWRITGALATLRASDRQEV
jgi:hypothetical protein